MPDLSVDWENLDAAFAELEKEVTEITRGVIVTAWNSILLKTPQYYGGLAASWTWTSSPNFFRDNNDLIPERADSANRLKPFVVGAPKYRGHPAAIGIANRMSMGQDEKFKLGDTVYFTNGADHGEGPYAARLENPEFFKQNIRVFNSPGRMVGRTIDAITASFGVVSRDRGKRLAKLRIGDVTGDS